MPDLAGLELLVSVERLGSLSRVAALLGISQQAVSWRVRSLEAQVGADLIRRSARGSSLTETGVMVAGWAADVLATAEKMDVGIELIRSQVLRQLDVAASLTIAEYLLPRWLVSLRDRQESAGLTPTRVGHAAVNSEVVIALVREGKVPLGFIETPAVPPDLRSAVVGRDRLRVIVSPRHAWAGRRGPLTVHELAGTSLITREKGSGTRTSLEQLLAGLTGDLGMIAPPRAELSSTAAVRTAVASGVAPGVLSSLAIADDVALGRLVAVDVAGADMTRSLLAVWANGPRPSQGPARELIALARDSFVHP